MIGLAVFLIILIITGVYAKATFNSNKRASNSGAISFSFRYITTISIMVLLAIAAGIWQPYALERIDAGCVGLKVALVGKDRGTLPYQFATGWEVYNVYTEQIIEVPTSQQHAEYPGQVAIAKGGFPVTIAPSFNYEAIAENAGDMYINQRMPLAQIQEMWMKNSTIGAVNDVTNKWSVDSIFNYRTEYEVQVMGEINIRVGKWFRLSQIRTGITPPEALEQSIQNKTKAIQDALAEQARNQVIKMENLNKIMTAQGDSAQQVIAAKASAEVMRIKKLELTPLYVEYLKVTNWDGKNSTTLVTDATSTNVILK